MNITTVISKNIRLYRQLKGLKLETLADEICISKATMSQIENGHVEITISRIEKIAKVLGVEYNLLVMEKFENNILSTLLYTDGSNNSNNNVDVIIMQKVLELTKEVIRLVNR